MHKKVFLAFLSLLVPIFVLAGVAFYFGNIESVFANSTLKYVAIGDSITNRGADQADGWVQVYKNYLNQDLHTTTIVTNLGVDAAKSGDILDRLNNNQNFISAVSSADLVTVEVGTNDFFAGRGAYNEGTCGGQNNEDCLISMVSTFQSNFDELLNRISALNPSANIKVMDIYYSVAALDQPNYGTTFPVLNTYLSQMNNHIQTKSASLGIEVAQVHTAFNGVSGAGNPIGLGYILPDAIHPTTLGHSIIAQEFRALGYADLDSDSDTVADATDNCPTINNTNQANFNAEPLFISLAVAFNDNTNPIADSIGDACDPDMDHDGLTNVQEASLLTYADKPDTDTDGVLDGTEVACSSDPRNFDKTPKYPNGKLNPPLPDSDNDVVPNSCEAIYGTNPNSSNSDTDGVNDGTEILYKGTNPLANDTDNDGCSDGTELASVNGDRTVSSIDLGQVAQRFGATRTSPNYHYVFDVNGDGNINAIDNGFVSQRFGQSCP